MSLTSTVKQRLSNQYNALFLTQSAGVEIPPGPLQKHRDIRSGSLRAAIFGLNDGLISNISLVLGTVGAHSSGGVIRLAGLAGLFGGSFSMAAGEYISMSGQVEVFERELSLEREELDIHPDLELQELVEIYLRRGISADIAHKLGAEIMSDPGLALAAHAREELGIDPDSLGSPIRAALASFFTFAFGAFIPLIPFLSGSGSFRMVMISISLTVATALGIGAGLSIFTLRTRFFSAMRSLLICAVAGGVTYVIGSLIGIAASHH
ncbi:MAG TPA: VIT1/CCC1 transporter family protein [Acidimicrobiales bacterium]|nr:VIT1/CCC1 transporter family protein [Acidimicrobiales bacterium]